MAEAEADAQAQLVKEEDDSGDGAGRAPISASVPKMAKSVKKEPEAASYDDDDEDNVPLAKATMKKKANPGNHSKVKKEDIDQNGDSKNQKVIKKEDAKSNAKLVKVMKEDLELSEDDDLEDDVKKRKTKTSSSSKVKKEEIDEDIKLKNQKVIKKEEAESYVKSVKVKKRDPELSNDNDQEDNMDKKKIKKKNKREEEEKIVGKKRKVSDAGGKEKREKKVYDMPGQKHDPPEERDPLRIFYETLYNQVPTSEMAAIWMMEWGLLSKKEAEKICERKLQKAQQQKLGSPTKPVTVKKTSTGSVKKVTEKVVKSPIKVTDKRKASDSQSDNDEEDDFIISRKNTKKQKLSR